MLFRSLWGVASRTDFDLTAHQNTSGKDQTYFDQESGEHFVPYVIEPSLGADRVVLAFLVDAYITSGADRSLAHRKDSPRSSMAEGKNENMATSTGACRSIGRHPENGLAPARL